jgi:hypothetical protein
MNIAKGRTRGRGVAIGASTLAISALAVLGVSAPAFAGQANLGAKSCTEGHVASQAYGNYTITHLVHFSGGPDQLVSVSSCASMRWSTNYTPGA